MRSLLSSLISRVPRLRRLDGDSRAFVVGYAILLPLFLVPLWLTPVLPFLDAPFHLAMADMLAKGSGSASPYAGFYAPRFWPPPPALPWVALALLGKVVGATAALRLLVAAYVAALPLAVAALARRLGGAARPALLAFPLTYNMALHYGFLGYAFSLPLLFAMLACVAGYLAPALTPAPARSPLRGAAVLAASGCVLFACHLETYGIGVVAMVAMVATARGAATRRALALIALLPSLALAAAWNAGTPYLRGVTTGRSLANALVAIVAIRRSEIGERSVLADLWSRLEGLPHHLLRGFHDGADRIASLALLFLIGAFALSLARPELRAPQGHALARCRVVLPAVALAGYLMLPHHFDEYEAMSVAPRLAPLVALAIIAAIPVSAEALVGTPARVARVLGYAALGLGLAYGGVLGREYRAFAREVQDFESVVLRIPAGGRVVGLVYDGESRVMNVESVLRALPSLYVALRPDPQSMVALRYCGMRHFPCRPGPRAAEVPASDPWTPERFDVRLGLAFFDFILVRSGPPKDVLFGAEPVDVLARSGTWTAYARHPAPPRSSSFRD